MAATLQHPRPPRESTPDNRSPLQQESNEKGPWNRGIRPLASEAEDSTGWEF